MFNLNSTKHLESDRVFALVSDHIDFSLLASFPFLSSVRTASALIQSLKPFEPALIASSHPIISFQAISFLHSTSRHVFVSHRIASAPLKSSCHLRTCLFKSFRFFRSDLLDLSRFSSSKLFISKLVGSSHPIKSFRPLRVSSPRFGSPHQVKAFRVFLSSFRPFSSTTFYSHSPLNSYILKPRNTPVIRFFSDRVFAHVRIKSSNLCKPYLFDLSYLVLSFLTESPKLHDSCILKHSQNGQSRFNTPNPFISKFYRKLASTPQIGQNPTDSTIPSTSRRFYNPISLNSTIQVK